MAESSFRDMGLSEETLEGLEESGYKIPSAIQSLVISPAVSGEDILAAARTGSGKTLAFLVPILERLAELKWAPVYGLGALIITPTRELAMQIYNVLIKIGKHHSFSTALVIGGQGRNFEWERLKNINIIICTPGRLLDHMDKNASFSAADLKILVLDEADRLLDLGFEQALNAIIENLPAERQTLLFSATQTKKVKDLSRLSLTNPTFLSADDDATFATPDKLKQNYVVLNPEDKLNFLWSFLIAHRQSKVLVFLACCKEVTFFHGVLEQLRRDKKTGFTVLALCGSKHQLKRQESYDIFYRKEHAVLLATDIASRGLDFPAVDYVLQLDCPDSVVQYIHRVGRTARYNSNGSATLIMTPTEEERFVPLLEAKKIPILKMEANAKFLEPVQKQLSSILARYPEMRESAQRCFKAYLKSVYMVRKKDLETLNLNAYAESLGLHGTPRVRFLERHRREVDSKAKSKSSGPQERVLEKLPQAFQSLGDEEDEEDVLKPKKVTKKQARAAAEKADAEEPELVRPPSKNTRTVTKASVVKGLMKKGIRQNIRIKFDDEGNVAEVDGPLGKGTGEISEGLDLNAAKEMIAKANEEDRIAERWRVKQKHKEERKQRKALIRKPGQPLPKDERGDEEEEFGAVLGGGEDEAEFGVTLGGSDDDGGEEWTPGESLPEMKRKGMDTDLEDSVETFGVPDEELPRKKRKVSKKGLNESSETKQLKKRKADMQEKETMQFDEDLALRLLSG